MDYQLKSEFKMQMKLFNRLKSVKWKNGKAPPNCAYIPTTIEHCANVFTHAIWILPSLIGLHNLLIKSQTPAQFLAATIYGSSLILLFTVSTFFHSVFFCTGHSSLKEFLHRCDRAVIYIFIAGSYCPWSLLEDFPEGSLSAHICWLIWVLACLGITYQQLFHERFKMLETIFYCCMGVVPSLIIVHQQPNIRGWESLRNGGLIYLIGVFFFKADGRIPCAHAIWHLFVAFAAALHYSTISQFLYSDINQTAQ